MSEVNIISPSQSLTALIGKPIVVRLKWNKTEYRGMLKSTDKYMNLQLSSAYEATYNHDGKVEEDIGDIFIRCNNVLFIREYHGDQT